MRLICSVFLLMAAAVASTAGHPHDEPEILVLSGTLRKVDAATRSLELDTIDPRTNSARNLLLFVDKKVKLRAGDEALTLEDLEAGQRVRCTVEFTYDDAHTERGVAFEIQVEPS